MMTMNNVCIQPNVVGQKVSSVKNNSTVTKYLTHNSPSISSISQTPCMSTTQYRSNENFHGTDQRVTTYRTIQPTDTRPSSVTKSVTVINHPMNINSESSRGQISTKKEADWNQLYVLRYILLMDCTIAHLFFIFHSPTAVTGTVLTLAFMNIKVCLMVLKLQRYQVQWMMLLW